MELVLRENNLYRNGYLVELDNTDEVLLLRDTITIDDSAKNQYHVLKNLDRLDLLAYKYYGNIVEDASKYWWIIADANDIQNPLDLTEFVGTQIIIPDILKVLISLE